MNPELIVTAAATWWKAAPDSHDHLITAWALRAVGAATWRMAVNATAPPEARRG
jgi:hypothetical protein